MMIGIVNSISFIDSPTDTFSGVILQMAFSCEMHHEIRKWKSGMQKCDHDDVSRRTRNSKQAKCLSCRLATATDEKANNIQTYIHHEKHPYQIYSRNT